VSYADLMPKTFKARETDPGCKATNPIISGASIKWQGYKIVRHLKRQC